jgi:hypothetical protein
VNQVSTSVWYVPLHHPLSRRSRDLPKELSTDSTRVGQNSLQSKLIDSRQVADHVINKIQRLWDVNPVVKAGRHALHVTPSLDHESVRIRWIGLENQVAERSSQRHRRRDESDGAVVSCIQPVSTRRRRKAVSAGLTGQPANLRHDRWVNGRG